MTSILLLTLLLFFVGLAAAIGCGDIVAPYVVRVDIVIHVVIVAVIVSAIAEYTVFCDCCCSFSFFIVVVVTVHCVFASADDALTSVVVIAGTGADATVGFLVDIAIVVVALAAVADVAVVFCCFFVYCSCYFLLLNQTELKVRFLD